MLGKDLSEVRRSGMTGFDETTHHAAQALLDAQDLRAWPGAARGQPSACAPARSSAWRAC